MGFISYFFARKIVNDAVHSLGVPFIVPTLRKTPLLMEALKLPLNDNVQEKISKPPNKLMTILINIFS